VIYYALTWCCWSLDHSLSLDPTWSLSHSLLNWRLWSDSDQHTGVRKPFT